LPFSAKSRQKGDAAKSARWEIDFPPFTHVQPCKLHAKAYG